MITENDFKEYLKKKQYTISQLKELLYDDIDEDSYNTIVKSCSGDDLNYYINGIGNLPSTIHNNSLAWNQTWSNSVYSNNSSAGSSNSITENFNLSEDNTSSNMYITSTKDISIRAKRDTVLVTADIYKNTKLPYNKTDINGAKSAVKGGVSSTLYLYFCFRPCIIYQN